MSKEKTIEYYINKLANENYTEQALIFIRGLLVGQCKDELDPDLLPTLLQLESLSKLDKIKNMIIKSILRNNTFNKFIETMQPYEKEEWEELRYLLIKLMENGDL